MLWSPREVRSDTPARDPYESKRLLARSLTEWFAGPGAGLRKQERFDAQFTRGELPDEMPERKLDGELVHLPAQPLDRPAGELTGRALQRGKRQFARLR